MIFWRMYGGRRFSGSYEGGFWEVKDYRGFNFLAGIHPGKPGENLVPRNPGSNVTEGQCTIYTRFNLQIASENGEGDYVRWEGRWWRVNEEERHGILIPHNRYVCLLADLPIPDTQNLVDVFATIRGQGTVTGTGAVGAGSTVTLTAIPADGWEFVKWVRGDSGVTEEITTPVYSFTAPERGLTLECHFQEIPDPVDPPDPGGGP